MHRPPYILSASTNLLGICFIIIGGLKFTDSNSGSYADEVAWVAALLLFLSTLNAYLAIRCEGRVRWHAPVADWAFLGGLTALAGSVVVGEIFL